MELVTTVAVAGKFGGKNVGEFTLVSIWQVIYINPCICVALHLGSKPQIDI